LYASKRFFCTLILGITRSGNVLIAMINVGQDLLLKNELSALFASLSNLMI
jgi:hypothetical protein